jgi:Na+-transporting NADH:ubiquinone oxidoreductase subunit NqrF
MTPLLRKLHKWVGLLVGVQFLLWLASGMVMSLFDHHAVAGQAHRAAARMLPDWPASGLLAPADVAAAARKPVESVDSHWLLQVPAYRLNNSEGSWLVDARSGAPLAVTAQHARELARADYQGDGKPGQPQWLPEPSLEVRKHRGPSWRVDFDDGDGTTVYVSAEDGRILERRNTAWRLFDIAWMLHIMDYSGREDFNNSLLVMCALGGLWMALSGIWLLCTSMRWHAFVPRRLLPARQVTVLDEAGKRLGIVRARHGDTVFDALARSGIQLPSNCGGGQSCGLCEVRACRAAPPASSSDGEHIPEQRLRRGHRLACGMAVGADMEIAVSHGAALMASRGALVERVSEVTPSLREVVLRPEQKAGSEFRPGSFIQLHIPPRRRLFGARRPLRRSYSLALPVAQAGGCITLLVRHIAGGAGSSYVHALKPGERVSFSGPFGEFALRKGRNAKVFIGGGAGMAPLRAMIRAQLESGAKEPVHFWYGARSEGEVPYRAEFDELAARYAHFGWHVVLSDGGRMVHEAVREELFGGGTDADACDFYVCGPPAMLHATREMLKEQGARRVAFDDFKI